MKIALELTYLVHENFNTVKISLIIHNHGHTNKNIYIYKFNETQDSTRYIYVIEFTSINVSYN